jgi:hypothetical protein
MNDVPLAVEDAHNTLIRPPPIRGRTKPAARTSDEPPPYATEERTPRRSRRRRPRPRRALIAPGFFPDAAILALASFPRETPPAGFAPARRTARDASRAASVHAFLSNSADGPPPLSSATRRDRFRTPATPERPFLPRSVSRPSSPFIPAPSPFHTAFTTPDRPPRPARSSRQTTPAVEHAPSFTALGAGPTSFPSLPYSLPSPV